MSECPGRVLALSVSEKKGTPKTNVEKVRLVRDWGMEGDAHSGSWHRQLSLLSIESIDKIRAKGLSVRPGAFAENITSEFVDIPGLKISDRLRIGVAIVEITQIGKECTAPCAIYHAVGDCVMPREGVFARVLKGGVLCVGDRIERIGFDERITVPGRATHVFGRLDIPERDGRK